MTTEEALYTAAADAYEAINAEEAAASRVNLAAAREASSAAYQAAYRGLMANLVQAAYAGDAFAKGYVTEAFGDLQFDPEGEEYGHFRTLPADQAAVLAKVHAADQSHAKYALGRLRDGAYE